MTPDRALEYGDVVTRSYPPGHPDREPAGSDPASTAEAVLDVMRDAPTGRWIADASLHVADDTDRVVGFILVTETTASSTFRAGPVVTDVCVIPAAAGHGLGSALLTASADRLADLGRSSLTVVVTVGNPARHVYERMGFRVTAESWRSETTG